MAIGLDCAIATGSHFGGVLAKAERVVVPSFSSFSQSVKLNHGTLRYAIMFPGRKSAFRVGFWPVGYLERSEIGPPAGLLPAGGFCFVCFPGSSPARIWLARPILGPEALVHNMMHVT